MGDGVRAEYRKQHSDWQIWENVEGRKKGREGKVFQAEELQE